MKLSPQQRGATLIELMATLLVIAVLAGMALPSFLEMVRNNRAQSQSALLLHAFTYARSEAVRRNAEVHITALSDTGWNSGWRVWVTKNTEADHAFDADSDTELQVQAPFSGAATLTNPNSIVDVVFTGNGFLRKEAGYTFATELIFQYRVDAHCELGRDISLIYAGRVSIVKQDCNDADTAG